MLSLHSTQSGHSANAPAMPAIRGENWHQAWALANPLNRLGFPFVPQEFRISL
jgi:hypothetical protein